MVRQSRAVVELLLWLGVVAGLSLLFLWWDVRPGAAVDYRPEDGDADSLFTASFLLIASATSLVLLLRGQLPLARLAAAVAGLALVIGGGPLGDLEDAAYLGIVLRVAGVLLWVMVVRGSVWEELAPRRRMPGPLAVVLTTLLAILVLYAVLVLAYAERDAFPAYVVPATALLAWVSREASADVARTRGPDHGDVA